MRKGLKTLIAGIIIFLVGFIVIPVATIVDIISKENDGWQFVIPGTTQIQIEKPGKYYLWNNFHTVFNGRTYSQHPQIPNDLTIRFSDAQGNQLPFATAMEISVNIGSNSKNSIGFIEVTSPTEVTVEVLGDVEERVFSIAPFEFKAFIKNILACIACALIGCLLSIWGIIKLCRNGEKTQHTTTGIPPA